MSHQDFPRQFRREPRYAVRPCAEPWAWLRIAPSEDWQPAKLVDLSRHGLRMELPQQPTVDAVLELRLTIDGEDQITRTICVRWKQISVRGQWWVGGKFSTPLPQAYIDQMARAGVLERRGQPRLRLQRAVQVKWQLAAQWQAAELHDYSPIGFQLRLTQQQAWKTDRILVRIEHDGISGRAVEIPARIVWQSGEEDRRAFGCTFIHHEHYTEFRLALGLSTQLQPPAPLSASTMFGSRRRMAAILLATLLMITISGLAWFWT